VVERILHNLSLLMDRSFKSVQELNRYRKELQATLANPPPRRAAAARGVSEPAFLAKIVARAQAPRRPGRPAGPVVFTNGVFDVLHRGHVTYLAQAARWAAAWWWRSTPMPRRAASARARTGP
jgi:hypothetical protein